MGDVSIDLDVDVGNALVLVRAGQVQYPGVLSVDRSAVIIEEGGHRVIEGSRPRSRDIE